MYMLTLFDITDFICGVTIYEEREKTPGGNTVNEVPGFVKYQNTENQNTNNHVFSYKLIYFVLEVNEIYFVTN